MTTGSNTRMASLDLLRGLTVAGMILVNNGYGESFATLRHSQWNGLTACDLVFPFFLFIMGISCYLSLSKAQFTPTRDVVWHVCRRTLLLFAIGLFINWFHLAIGGDLPGLARLRVWAVLQRIALCYFFVSMFALYANHRYTVPTIVGLLIIYSGVLVFGHGYSENAAENILARVDLGLFGYDHIYHKSPVDPEGLVATISSVAHVLTGFYCGQIIRQREPLARKLSALLIVGLVLLAAGCLLSLVLPLNKRVWSPSYVLVTCGLATLLLVLIERLPFDARRCTALMVFGVNALAIYVASELLSIVFGHFGIDDAVYALLHAVIPWDKWASLAYALAFVAINWLLGYILWKKHIYIKL